MIFFRRVLWFSKVKRKARKECIEKRQYEQAVFSILMQKASRRLSLMPGTAGKIGKHILEKMCHNKLR